jgi:perosamine synthetase
MESIAQIKPIIGTKEAKVVNKYLLSGGWLTEHTYTEEFEKQICSFLDIDYCSVVPNGTLGLILALMALGIKRGDKVAVPALTMIATANAIKFIGAEPVFTDVDMFGCMNISTLKKKVNAVIYVDFNGNSSGLGETIAYCFNHNVPLIEDACQAFGSKENFFLGTVSDIGVFSFSPHKIITTGQGGAIVTHKKELHERIERLKDFGRLNAGEDYYPEFGINAKFTDLQAIIGIEQLKTISKRLEKKKQIYQWYSKYLDDLPLMYWKENVPWFICGYFKDRDLVRENLKIAEVQTRIMYPALSNLPTAKILSEHCLWLPSSLDLTEEAVRYICNSI